ncbi:MAG: hypothetical protein MUF23_10985 [Pirellula sp.]|nr:hypothetical protein [Pirellula sp.]
MASCVAQRWQLVGLHPMHEAMIRRIAKEECEAASRDAQAELSILWSRTEKLTQWSDWSRASQADVIIMDADRLVDAMEAAGYLNSTTLLATGKDQCLRLIWKGLDGNMDDLCWSTEWLACGVIADAISLRAWTRSAVRHARTIPKPPHPFLPSSTAQTT